MKKHKKQTFYKQKCLFCEKTSMAARFIEHVATHTNENGYICKKCPAEFRTPHQISRHMATAHSKPLKHCCLFCDMKFLSLHDLEKHLIYHTKEKWFECKNCANQYSTQNELARHWKSCQNEKFQCDLCTKKFCNFVKLRNHRSTHIVQYKCSICNSVFKSKSGLQGHIEAVHPVDDRYKCSHCMVICVSKSRYIIHLRKHTGEKPFACDKCPKRFSRRNLLRTHQESHDATKLKNWMCQQCGRQSYSKKEHLMHMNTHTKPHSCDICDKRFAGKETLKTHILSHTGERPFKCKLCPNTYRAQNQLAFHENSVHGTKPPKHQCDVCQKLFHRKYDMRLHRRTHRFQKRLFKCVFCESTFRTWGAVRSHLHCHTNEAPFICNTCGSEYKSGGQLAEHNLREHAGDKPYTCEKCPRQYSQKILLRKHVASHDIASIRDLVCPDCGKQFYTKSTLVMHLDTHSKPYSCELCNERFSTVITLETHILSHTGERPFKCKLCPNTYRGKSQLTHHQNTFHGLRRARFQCKFCDKLLHRSCELRNHLRRHRNQRLYECLFCEKSFFTVTSLRDHIWLHTNESPFICKSNMCGGEFTTKQQLNQHDCQDILALIFNEPAMQN